MKSALEALDALCLHMCSTLNCMTGEERIEARISLKDATLIRAALSEVDGVQEDYHAQFIKSHGLQEKYTNWLAGGEMGDQND